MTQMLDTSLSAYESIIDKLNEKQQKVLAILKADWTKNALCNYEIADWLDWPINCVTGRIKELRDKGLVVDDGKRPGPPTGRSVHYWKAVKVDKLF